MRQPIAACAAFLALAGLLAAPALAADSPAETRAKAEIAPNTTTVQPPPGHPGAYTPAPVPGIGPQTVPPESRAGNADDAGPINATPMSSNQSQGLGTPSAAPAARPVDPTGNAVPTRPPEE